jgi:hypothetical protein
MRGVYCREGCSLMRVSGWLVAGVAVAVGVSAVVIDVASRLDAIPLPVPPVAPGLAADLPSKPAVPDGGVEVVHFWVDSAPPPGSASGMVAEAATVVVARYTGEHTYERTPSASPWTRYAFAVQETIKSERTKTGDHLEIALLGGDENRVTHTVRHVPFEVAPLVRNRVYVLFLSEDRLQGRGRHPAWAFRGIYDVAGETVSCLQTTWWPQNGRSVEEFLEELRAAATRG